MSWSSWIEVKEYLYELDNGMLNPVMVSAHSCRHSKIFPSSIPPSQEVLDRKLNKVVREILKWATEKGYNMIWFDDTEGSVNWLFQVADGMYMEIAVGSVTSDLGPIPSKRLS